MNLIAWADAHSGFVMAVLTGVYVIATLLIVRESRRTANLQAKSLEQAAKLEVDRLRPRVLVSFQFMQGSYRPYDSQAYAHLNVRNLGQSAAHDLIVGISPEPLGSPFDDKEARKSAILGGRISMLAPQQLISDLLGAGSVFAEKYRDTIFVVKATYKDAAGSPYSDQYEIGLQPDTWRIQDPMQETIWQLKRNASDAAKDLHAIAASLASPDRSSLMLPLPPDTPLTTEQAALLRSLRQISATRSVQFFAHRTVDKEAGTIRSTAGDEELEAQISDIEFLIRAGRLHGHYSSGSLFFSLTAAGADQTTVDDSQSSPRTEEV